MYIALSVRIKYKLSDRKLTNLKVSTILGLKFSDKFGFTEEELKNILEYYNE